MYILADFIDSLGSLDTYYLIFEYSISVKICYYVYEKGTC